MPRIKKYALIVVKIKIHNKRLENIINDTLEEAKRNSIKIISKKIAYKYIYMLSFMSMSELMK